LGVLKYLLRITCGGHNTTYIIQYSQSVKRLLHGKAIALKRSQMSCLPEEAAYKTIAFKCSDAIKKYHAAKELEMIRKQKLTSFYNCVNG